MNNKNRKGFVLIFVITTLALMGAMFVVLGNYSRTFLFESNNAYLDACSRDLAASGYAWAKYNVEHNSQNLPSGRIPLDVNAMKIPGATVSLDIARPADGKAQVTVHTSVSRGRQRLRNDTAYLISAR
jgi:hypothetical protein